MKWTLLLIIAGTGHKHPVSDELELRVILSRNMAIHIGLAVVITG